jgi:DNA-binding NarL/FixJ family response regulator
LRQRGVRSIARGPRPSTRANLAGLTRRELDVLRLIDSGLSNADIANRLGVSTKTVDHHVSAILAKFQAATRGEAAARARKAGLFEGGRG